MKKVFLIGYMGSGKSVIANQLSKKLDVKSLELDELIEINTGNKINSIFETKGELYFRKLENEILTEIVNKKEDIIVSTGGGTPCYFNNIDLINKKNSISIYLQCSVVTLFNRLKIEKLNRPLVKNLSDEDLQQYIAKHLFERSFYYNQAKFTIRADNKTVEEIVNEIEFLIL